MRNKSIMILSCAALLKERLLGDTALKVVGEKLNYAKVNLTLMQLTARTVA